jgi:hypothetical protein
MFNLELLDKNKMYSGVSYNDDSVIFSPAYLIKLSGWKVLQDYKYLNIKFEDIPTHSFALVYRDFDWWVYESHIKTGVHKIKAWVWLYDVSRFELFEDELDIKKLKEKIGCGYGTIDIGAFFVDFIKSKPSWIHKLDHGLFCTEYIGLCQVNSILKHFYKLENYYELQPIHHLIALRERKAVNIKS